MNILYFFLYLVFLAVIFALLEIQIEGENGWAKNLPAWKIKGTWLNRLFEDREITGYHVFILLLTLAFLHFPFILFGDWQVALELRILGGFLIMMTLEDFLWFVFNPHFSLRRFFAKDVPWHKSWLGPLPFFYYGNVLIGGILIYLSL